MKDPSNEELVNALRAASKAHDEYQTGGLGGVRDERWAGWYAGYVLGRLGDFTSPTVLAGWLAAAPTSVDWAVSAADHVEDCLGQGGPSS
jgi:hypothetical protein